MANVTFKDSYGNEVADGDTVVMEAFYGWRPWQGREAVVKWDEQHGMYQYTMQDSHKISDNFYGVAKFKKI